MLLIVYFFQNYYKVVTIVSYKSFFKERHHTIKLHVKIGTLQHAYLIQKCKNKQFSKDFPSYLNRGKLGM